MVFPGDLESTLQELSPSLSPEQVEHARLKNAEINTSLGLSPEDPSEDEILEFDIGTNPDESNENYFSEEELARISEKNAALDLALQEANTTQTPAPTDENEKEGDMEINSTAGELPCTYISELEVMEMDENEGSCQMTVEAGGIGVIIPAEIHEVLAAGGVNLLLEPVLPETPGESVSFKITSVPSQQPNVPNPQSTPNTVPSATPNPKVDNSSDEDSATESEASAAETKKRKGLGCSHKGGQLAGYSLWMRMGVTSDIRLESMSPKDACEKWKAPRRRVRQWLVEYDRGDYADLPNQYTMEELKKKTRLKGGGAKIKDQVLEERLVTYYNQLKEELYPISTELLAYECLTHNEKFLGGATSPNFTKRVSDFLRHWRKRNNKRLRKPTSTGQKLPDGYTGKWEACAYYFYLETKGVPTKNVYHGDETKICMEDVPGKVYADAGAKRVPVRTSGQDKDNITGFLVQNAYGDKLPLYPILRGDTQANRPGMHTKKNNSSIRQRFQEVINRKSAVRVKSLWRNLQFWVNDTSFMDQQSFLHWGRTVWKYRADTSGEDQPVSVLLLDDLSSHKTKLIMDEFKRLYNTKIIILPGGLTPKAQIMDTHNNRPFKAKVRSMVLKLRTEKYKAAKAEAAADPLHKGRVGIPKLTREEIVQIMLDAWDKLDPSLGANGSMSSLCHTSLPRKKDGLQRRRSRTFGIWTILGSLCLAFSQLMQVVMWKLSSGKMFLHPITTGCRPQLKFLPPLHLTNQPTWHRLKEAKRPRAKKASTLPQPQCLNKPQHLHNQQFRFEKGHLQSHANQHLFSSSYSPQNFHAPCRVVSWSRKRQLLVARRVGFLGMVTVCTTESCAQLVTMLEWLSTKIQ